jgi:hypothetical protein
MPTSNQNWFALVSSFTQQTLEGAIQRIQSLSLPNAVRTNLLLGIGGLFGWQGDDYKHLVVHSDEDASIIAQALLISGNCRLGEKITADGINIYQRSVAAFIGSHRLKPVSDFRTFQVFLSCFLVAAPGDKFSDLLPAILDLKRNWWWLFGGDFFAFLQALLDPKARLTPSISRFGYLNLRTWGFDSLAIQLACIRSAIGDKEINAALEPLIEVTENSPAVELLESLLKNHIPVSLPPSWDESDPVSRIIAQLIGLRNAIKREDLPFIKRELPRLYDADPASVVYLEWPRLARLLETKDASPDIRSLFLIGLALQDNVRMSHSRGLVRYGRGFLIAQLETLVNSTSRVKVRGRSDRIIPFRFSNLFGRVKRALPGRASTYLMRELIQRKMVERIALLLADRSNFAFREHGQMLLRGGPLQKTGRATPARTPEQIDNRISIFRLEALQAAREHEAITTAEYERLRDEEQKIFRMNYFQEMRRRGRVGVDRAALIQEVVTFLEREVANLFQMQDLKKGVVTDAAFQEILVDFVARRITTLILADADSSIDMSFTTNLRHGVVVPAFLRAFEDALADVSVRSSDWTEPSLSRLFGQASGEIIELRKNINALLEEYVSKRLDVDHNDAFANKCVPQVRQSVAAALTLKMHADWRALAVSSVNAVLRVVRDCLVDERKCLTSQTAAEAMRLVSDAYGAAQKLDNTHYISQFFDSLQNKLHATFEEVAHWVQLVQRTPKVGRFTLDEIVNLELLTTRFSDAKRLRVRQSVMFISEEKAAATKPIHFKGRYFEYFVEVIHNLLLNCFEHSGLDLKTNINIVVALAPHEFSIRVSNDLSEAKFIETVKNLPQTIAAAQASNPKRAREDKLSGFQKIRWRTSKAFGSVPLIINIPPVVQRRFNIELIVRTSERVWLDDDQSADS